MTQFRTFSIAAVEKQWGRNRNMYGVLGAFGIIMGSAPVAIAIHAARTATQALGREDKEEFLERRLSPAALFQAVMLYVGQTGLAGEVVDLLTAIPGLDALAPAGGRGGKGAIGGSIAPSVGLLNDAAAVIPSLKNGMTDAEKRRAWGTLPLNTVPLLQIPFNLLTQ